MSRRGCYVDNELNRRLGRVGKPYGSHVLHEDGTMTVTNRSRGYNSCDRNRATSSYSTCSSRTASHAVRSGCYVDNEYNRRLGRVGKPYGSHVLHEDGTVTVKNSQPYQYYTAPSRVEPRPVYTSPSPSPSPPLSRKPTPKALAPYEEEAVSKCDVWSKPVHFEEVKKPIPTEVNHRSPDEELVEKCLSNPQLIMKIKELVTEQKPDVKHQSSSLQVAPFTEETVSAVHEQRSTSHDTPTATAMVMTQRQVLERQTIEVVVPTSGQAAISQLRLERPIKVDQLPSTYTQVQSSPAEKIPYEELCLPKESVIGSGSYGEVHKGTWRGREIAYKKFKYQQIMTHKRKMHFMREVKIFAALQHPNVVRMFGIVEEEGKYGIVMEYLIRTLHKAVLDDCTPFPKEHKKKIVPQIASALLYLHTHKDGPISHGDLKSANVLLDKDNNAKLSDFGMSRIKNASSSSQSKIDKRLQGDDVNGGTPQYSAPEILCGKILILKQHLQADIYSLSMVVFEIIVEVEPFEDLDERQLVANVGHGTMRPPVDELSEGVASLLTRCWEKDAERRPTAGQFLEEWESLDPAAMEF